MRTKAILPHNTENIPQDKQLPDGMGLPVLAHYEGDPIGRVVEWQDRGDGTVEATLELDRVLFDPDTVAFGLDARCQANLDTDPPTVTRIVTLIAIGAWPEGTRPGDHWIPPDQEMEQCGT